MPEDALEGLALGKRIRPLGGRGRRCSILVPVELVGHRHRGEQDEFRGREHRVPVEFGGEIIKLNCRPEDEAYCRFLADKVRKLAEQQSGGDAMLTPAELILLAAMAMADELYGNEYGAPPPSAAEGPDALAEREALQGVFRHL